MPESRYAKTGDVKDHNTFDMDALKQYGRDLLEEAAKTTEVSASSEQAAHRIRKLKETL